MVGEKNLAKILRTLSPSLHPEPYVFLTLANTRYGDMADLNPFASILEDEGLTLIVTQQRADALAQSYEGTYSRITLRVHSSLDAVGLTAAVSHHLAQENISANIIAGFYHDHIFVAERDKDLALRTLQALSS